VFIGGVLIAANLEILSFDLCSSTWLFSLFLCRLCAGLTMCRTWNYSILNATNCNWFTWCGSLLWLNCSNITHADGGKLII